MDGERVAVPDAPEPVQSASKATNWAAEAVLTPRARTRGPGNDPADPPAALAACRRAWFERGAAAVNKPPLGRRAGWTVRERERDANAKTSPHGARLRDRFLFAKSGREGVSLRGRTAARSATGATPAGSVKVASFRPTSTWTARAPAASSAWRTQTAHSSQVIPATVIRSWSWVSVVTVPSFSWACLPAACCHA